MPLSAGQSLTFYEILGPLGAGGMGEVYRAKDTRLDREVAIKVLPAHFAEDEERLRRFEREAKMLASLNHTNIAGIHGFDREGETCFLAMELVPGEDLAARLASGRLGLDETIDVCRQIAEGLEAAHEAGVVHRDLKPANVRLTPDGAVKVLDFGLAKPIRPNPSEDGTTTAESDSFLATETGMVLGTPTYMSPEQARGKPVDRRTDIWAFGCVLFECLTGERAFGGRAVAEILAAVLERGWDRSALPADTPQHVRALLERCLDKDPRSRLRDIGEARLALCKTLGEDPDQAGSASAGVGRPLIALVTLAVLTVGVLLGYGLFGGRSTPATASALLRLDLAAPEGLDYYLYGSGPGPVALSPDGTHVAFTAAAAGEVRALWVRDLSGPAARRMPGTENADYPFWSPDGEHLGFFADGSLQRTRLSGGPPEVLAEAGEGKGGAWSPTGWIVFTPSSYEALHAVRDSGGEVRTLTDLEAEPAAVSHRLPSFLPDGERFLFLARDAAVGSIDTPHSVLVGSLDGGPQRFVMRSASQAQVVGDRLFYVYQGSVLTRGFDPVTLELEGEPIALGHGVATIPGAALALFSAARDRLAFHAGQVENETTLVRTNLGGKELESISTPQVALGFSLHSDSGRIAATLVEPATGKHSVWLYDQQVESWHRLLTSGETRWPTWLPSGDELVFSDEHGIHRVSIHGAGEPSQVIDGADCIPSDITSDGRQLLFDRVTEQRGRDIFISPLDRSTTPVPLVEGLGDDYNARWSPAGDWVGYTSTEQGIPQVYVQAFPDSTRRFHVSSHGTFAGWHPDGDRLYFVDDSRRLIERGITLDASSFALGATRQVLEATTENLNARCFAFQTDTLLYRLRAPFGRGAQVVRVVLGWRALLNDSSGEASSR